MNNRASQHADRHTEAFGWRVWGFGIALIGAVNLALGNFDPGQAVSETFPDRLALAAGANGFMVIAGVVMQWRRLAPAAAIALTAYFGIVVAIVMDGHGIIAHPEVYGAYSNVAEQLALAAAGLVVFSSHAGIKPQRAALLTRLGRVVFGVCVLLFGGAHFVYMNLTAPLVPRWLPPSQLFWGEATGFAQIAAGVALISGIQARLAAILLTVMYAAFTPLVHLPLLLGAPTNAFYWTENALNIALVGAAWVVADSLAGGAERGWLPFARNRHGA